MLKPLKGGRIALLSAAGLALVAIAQPAGARTIEIEFDADNFDAPLVIDNQYLPLAVGATFTYKAETADGCEVNVVTVAPAGNPTKDITIGDDTLTVRVVQDLEYEDTDCDGAEPSELVEKTFDWFGQDNFDNIWYFGEETFDCEGEGSCVIGSGAWEAGVNDALPGIIMLGDPDSGERYRQEFAEGVAEDWGMVMNLNRRVRLRSEDAFPPGTWSNCLITKEWNALEPGSVEQKTYCPNVGLVLITEHSGKLVRFELQDPDVDAAVESDAFRFRDVR